MGPNELDSPSYYNTISSSTGLRRQQSSFLHNSDNPINLNLPRSREAAYQDSDEERTSPDVFLSGDDIRQSIHRKSYERVAEKSRRWSSLAQERNEELISRIESEAKESTLSRLQAENLVNAQYRIQRQQREHARDQRRLGIEAYESFSPTHSIPVSSIEKDVSAEKGEIQKHGRESGRAANQHRIPLGNQDDVLLYLDSLRKLMHSLSTLISSLPPADVSTESIKEIHQRYQQISQQSNTLVSSLASGDVPDGDMSTNLATCLKEATTLMLLTEKELKNISEEEEKRRQTEQIVMESEMEVIADQHVDEKPPIVKEAVGDLSSTDRAKQIYDIYSQKAKVAKSAFAQLETDPALKQLKSAVLFASSNPVTICSTNSPMDIIEPYRKAFLLLRGSEVDTDSIKIRLSDHTEIVHYVRYNMAKKFIVLAGMQTEERNEIKLFALASLITELWACDREFGETFLALLFSEYPVLIPYYGKLSLKVEGNVDQQLKKLGALSKFYAAIMQTDRIFLLRRLFPSKSFEGRNPHGVEAGWALLSGLVNQDVQIGTIVLVLRNILSISGWMLHKSYGKQFTKLIIYISKYVLPKINEKTPPELQGPVERLSGLLDTFHRINSVAVPENRLSEGFWMS